MLNPSPELSLPFCTSILQPKNEIPCIRNRNNTDLHKLKPSSMLHCGADSSTSFENSVHLSGTWDEWRMMIHCGVRGDSVDHDSPVSVCPNRVIVADEVDMDG